MDDQWRRPTTRPSYSCRNDIGFWARLRTGNHVAVPNVSCAALIHHSGRSVRNPEDAGAGSDITGLPPSPHISQRVGASGFRIGESSFARRTFSEAEVFPDAGRV
jgi:hypothetical protein